MNAIAPGVLGRPGSVQAASSWVASFLNRIVSRISVRRHEKRLRLCEMLSLGEKRFVAVVEYGSEKFLLAGTPQNISLLKKFKMTGQSTNEVPHSGSDPE